MDDNRDDDERLLNQALDDVEQLFCVDDDDELVRLANALNSDQQQTTTTIPRQYLLASISVAIIAQCFSHYTSYARLAVCLLTSNMLNFYNCNYLISSIPIIV